MQLLRLWLVKANHHPIGPARAQPHREEDQGLEMRPAAKKLARPPTSTAREANTQPPTSPPRRPAMRLRLPRAVATLAATTITTTRPTLWPPPMLAALQPRQRSQLLWQLEQQLLRPDPSKNSSEISSVVDFVCWWPPLQTTELGKKKCCNSSTKWSICKADLAKQKCLGYEERKMIFIDPPQLLFLLIKKSNLSDYSLVSTLF